MKILLSTLLLPSLLLSCGKKEDQDSQVVSATESIMTLPQDDSDGDLIVNAKDPEPFIAKLPKYEEIIQLESEEKTFAPKEKFFVDEFVKDLKENGLEKTLMSSKKYYGYELNNNSIQTINSFKQVDSFDLELSTIDYNLQSFKEITELDIPKYPENILNGNPIRVHLSDYLFNYQGKELSKKELEKNILSRSFKVTIIDEKIDHFYISNLLTLEQGLQKIGREDLISQVIETNDLLSKSHLDLIDPKHDLFLIQNFDINNANKKLKAGSSLIFIKTNKTSLTSPSELKSESEINRDNTEWIIPLGRLNNFKKFNIKATLVSHALSFEKKRAISVTLSLSGKVNLKGEVHFKKHILKNVTIKEEHINSYFEFSIDGEVFNYSEIKKIQLENSNDKKLKIKLKYALKSKTLNLGQCFYYKGKCLSYIVNIDVMSPEETGPFLWEEFDNRRTRKPIPLGLRNETHYEYFKLSLDFQTNTIEWNVR